jgi:hypothetical protein
MKKIIQLTEAQLKKVVSNVISEQGVTDPNVNPRIRKIFDTLVTSVAGPGTSLNQLLSAFQLMQSADDFYTMSRILKANQKSANLSYGSIVSLLDGELDSDDLTTATAIQSVLAKIGIKLEFKTSGNQLVVNSFQFGSSPVAATNTTTTNTSTAGADPYAKTRKMTCAKFVAGSNLVNIKTTQGTDLSVYNNGRFASNKTGKKGYWQCNPQNGCMIDFVFDGETQVTYSESMVGCTGGGGGQKMQYTANENFPLKFGQRGKKIAQLQAAIGQQSAGANPYDGIFGPKTEALVKLFYPQYDRATGVTEEIFNTLMSPKNMPLSNTRLNTNINRFNTQTPAAPAAPVAPAAPAVK